MARTLWKKEALITSYLTILLLYLAWFSFPTCYLFKLFDQKVFLFLNSFIKESTAARNFWAFANHRFMDWVHDIVMVSFFVVYLVKAPKGERPKRLGQFIFTIGLFAFTILVINKTLIHQNYKILRNSPSLAYPDCSRLSEMVKWIYVKDYSRCSFPSDHGTTATLFVGAIFILMGWRAGLLAFLYGVFFSLPRMIVGAHWPTDVLVGSVTITLVMLSLGYFTPLCELFSSQFAKLFKPKLIHR